LLWKVAWIVKNHQDDDERKLLAWKAAIIKGYLSDRDVVIWLG